MNKIVLFVLLMLFLCGYAREFGYAKEFVERSVDSFQQLDEFSSISEFENDMNKYVQDCLGNSFGGSLSVRCFVGYELWV